MGLLTDLAMVADSQFNGFKSSRFSLVENKDSDGSMTVTVLSPSMLTANNAPARIESKRFR